MEGLVNFSSACSFQLHDFYEYLLVVHPPSEVYNQIREETQYFSSEYNVAVAKKTLPHITVANFLAREEMEETIIRYMRRIFSTQPFFSVALNNYSGLPEHTVFARIQDHDPFKHLATSLKVIDDYLRSNSCPPANLVTHPHVAIAKRLQKNIYDKAMFDYSRKIFHASFEVTQLVLVKRKNQFDKCERLSVFRLL
jgi:2'-5' RNA ligase